MLGISLGLVAMLVCNLMKMGSLDEVNAMFASSRMALMVLGKSFQGIWACYVLSDFLFYEVPIYE